MKKFFLVMLALFVLMVSSVLAQQMDLDPMFTTMSTTDSEEIDVCITDFSDDPLEGVVLDIDVVCRDGNTNNVCDGGDTFFPAGFSINIFIR